MLEILLLLYVKAHESPAVCGVGLLWIEVSLNLHSTFQLNFYIWDIVSPSLLYIH